MANLNDVLNLARNESSFAVALMVDQQKACAERGLDLNTTEQKVLTTAITASRKYLFQQIFLAANGPDALSDFSGGICC